MTNVLIFILIISVYTIIHNLGMYIPIKMHGVRVNKFYLWFDTKFSIFKTKIGETEFGLGWIPFGGYLNIEGMNLEEGEEILPYYFDNLSFLKRIVIVLGSSSLYLILGLCIYAIFYGITLVNIISLIAVFLVSFLIFFLLFKLVSPFTRKRHKSEIERSIIYMSIFLLYSLSLFVIGYCVNDFFPLGHYIDIIYSGDFKSTLFSQNGATDSLIILASSVGVFFFFINTLPLIALNGFNVVNYIYGYFTDEKIPERFVNYNTKVSVPIFLLSYGWLIYSLGILLLE